MMADFFRQDDGADEWSDQSEFQQTLREDSEIQHFKYAPKNLVAADEFRTIKDKRFRDISLSKTTVSGLSFVDCEFKDCYFIGTVWVQCEFRHCSFDNCNFYKADFQKCYLPPESLNKALDKTKHANIGMSLYRRLAEDARSQGHSDFWATAEFNYRVFKRYQLKHNLERRRINRASFGFRWLLDALLALTTGYGYRPWRLVRTIVTMFVILVAFNYFFWDLSGLNSNPNKAATTQIDRLADAAYYSAIMLSTVGFGDITPSTALGRMAATVQAILGVVMFAMLASIILRKLARL